jgi:hypothetical protein
VISAKTRKILWARSANRCAICKNKLTVDATSSDHDSVLGEECHIVSGKEHGPRFDASFPEEHLDGLPNLILLCPTDHKTVDDQCRTYTPQVLLAIKAQHEAWVSSRLTKGDSAPPLRIRRLKIPSHLVRITSGAGLLTLVGEASAYDFQHDEPENEAEVELLSGFLQEAWDYGEIADSLEAGDRVRAAFRISNLLGELEQGGFWVFGEQEVQRIEGGVTLPSSFPVAVLRVIRKTSPEIIKIVCPSDEPPMSDQA